MLARHAEDLLWIGRYLERAEDTARLLDVTYHTTLEAGDDEAALAAWQDLAEVLYLEDETEGMDRHELARFLVADPTNGGSIVAGVSRARENARGVREWLTLELWEEINAFHLELAGMDLVRALEHRPYALCELVRRRCETIIGVATAAMPRTEGYQFLLLGQLLERGGLTARLLSVWQRRLAGIGASAGLPGVDQGAALRVRVRGVPARAPRPVRRAAGAVVPARIAGIAPVRARTAWRSRSGSWSRSRPGRTGGHRCGRSGGCGPTWSSRSPRSSPGPSWPPSWPSSKVGSKGWAG